jgi:hypothetical protein
VAGAAARAEGPQCRQAGAWAALEQRMWRRGQRAAVAVAVAIGVTLPPPVARAERSREPSLVADDAAIVALALALSCLDPPPTSRGAAAAPEGAGPSVELAATVQARSLRFENVPELAALFRGGDPGRTTWRAERVNLPRRPVAGVTYRDVSVSLTLSTPLDDLEPLLRAAKRAARGVRIEQEAPRPAVIPARVR